MVNFSALLVTALASTASAALPAFTWTRCTNAPRCQSREAVSTGGFKYSGAVAPGGIFIFPGVPLSTYSSSTGFVYDRNDGYWYSSDKDGLYVSPTGYVHFAHGLDRIGINSKNQDIGSTYWSGGSKPCCLPDPVGRDILDVAAYNQY
ncbi:hypothetical protein CSOJ01_02367 [Colletotrichum sojae]|uniref:Uncharacterized protein n=1 Tax=Colletotrichum sojae TaxID=2175907 RepID=A0A8H6N2W5_9PEZI|nr:hypothetical protein CSOJ01_02367 [Colletotrichum sojae]